MSYKLRVGIIRWFSVTYYFTVDITVSQPSNNVDEETLLQRCLRAEGFKGKELEELTAGQRGQVVGCMNREHVSVLIFKSQIQITWC